MAIKIEKEKVIEILKPMVKEIPIMIRRVKVKVMVTNSDLAKG